MADEVIDKGKHCGAEKSDITPHVVGRGASFIVVFGLTR